ncbi:MAG: ACP S-malonyltransferase [Gammaproteobacteria bacterium]
MTNNQSFAIVFPGQGSQSTGMLAALASEYPVVRETFAEASEILRYDLWKLTREGPEAELNKTTRTQPALLAAGVAVWRCWIGAGGGMPAIMAGHSLGEYTALVCAGVVDFSDAVALVAERGRVMQAAVPDGAGLMAAILGLENEQVETVCAEASEGQTVTVANYNSPGQVVIAGDREAVERAVGLAREMGAKRALPLSVSVPSHCVLMKGAAGEFARTLDAVQFHDGTIPVIQNIDAQARTGADEIRRALVRQLHEPVLWVDTITRMGEKGIGTVIECGPGKVLTGLIRRIDSSMVTISINDPATLQTALEGRRQ